MEAPAGSQVAVVSETDGIKAPPLTKHPLWQNTPSGPSGHLPHCVVENVRGPRLHPHQHRGQSAVSLLLPSLNPRFVGRRRTLLLSPRRSGGGTRGARDDAGGGFGAGGIWGHRLVRRGHLVPGSIVSRCLLWQNTPSTLPGISPTCRRGRVSKRRFRSFTCIAVGARLLPSSALRVWAGLRNVEDPRIGHDPLPPPQPGSTGLWSSSLAGSHGGTGVRSGAGDNDLGEGVSRAV